MAFRLEVYPKHKDVRGAVRLKKLKKIGLGENISEISVVDVYTIDRNLNVNQLDRINSLLVNPVIQESVIRPFQKLRKPFSPPVFRFSVEIGFLPGVTDNVGNTARESIADALGISFTKDEGVYFSQMMLISGSLNKTEIEKAAETFYNPLIQRSEIKNYGDFISTGESDIKVPKVKLKKIPEISQVELNIGDEKLKLLGKKGILNKDGSRRGPLALDLPFMKKIQYYFRDLGRNPTDIELESLAQTWSEHCKHTIFNDPIDDISGGLFKTYIKKATDVIRSKKGKKDLCVSVFSDNSGAFRFDDKYLITHKVETHNSPSALDPFGGSITGIVGVNRDTIGFGLGAKPVANFYGFCLSDPTDNSTIYRLPDRKQKMLGSRRIMDGVIEGVNAGGNQSGIPTPSGFLYFDNKYRGKPLVFVGTVGLIPWKINGKPAYLKKARPGDLIIMAGGRVGKDGIHGATFSSESLTTGSPVTAVQIGDPITQKKLSDAIVKEARDQGLYHSITDNGAGGLSCSVAEMAKESGGCKVFLEKVPLKYPGLDPWEIWISESQERMTLAVPKQKWNKLKKLLFDRGVEATVIGEFTSSGKCTVFYLGKKIMDLDMNFLHYGLPKRPMKTSGMGLGLIKVKPGNGTRDYTGILISLLKRQNTAGYEFVSSQFDHIVQSNLVLGPLQGKGRVNSDVSVIKPVLDSQCGLAMSYALYPSLTEINPYQMAGISIDSAVRNVVAAGANPEKIFLLDNFCWSKIGSGSGLWSLKEAARGCFDFATSMCTPFISGKDSMYNDFSGYDGQGKKLEISVPQTLLITSVGIMDSVKYSVSLDAKFPGDIIYILGKTADGLGGSEYLKMTAGEKIKFAGPEISVKQALFNLKIYNSYYRAITKGLIASAVAVGRGGLAVALSKTIMGGKCGVSADLAKLGSEIPEESLLFSESPGRILVTVARENTRLFESMLTGFPLFKIGRISGNGKVEIRGSGKRFLIRTDVGSLLTGYRSVFAGY